MSIQNSSIRCSSCDYVSSLVHRPVTLVYQLPGGEELNTERVFCWCNTCGGIRNSEPDFSAYFDADNRIAELKKATGSLGSRAISLIDRLIGGSSTRYEQDELRDLLIGQKIARARNSRARCLECGETNIHTLDDYIHTCGGHLIRVAAPEDAPRFSYAPETIYLDFEGKRSTGPFDPYIQFAQTVEIECVMNAGLVALVYVVALFDELDFGALLADKEKFRKFARIIELRIMHDDFENPLSDEFIQPTHQQIASISEATRAIVLGNQKPISKWLRSQVM